MIARGRITTRGQEDAMVRSVLIAKGSPRVWSEALHQLMRPELAYWRVVIGLGLLAVVAWGVILRTRPPR